MKDYQQKKMRSYILPEAVYRQSLWALRDLNRLKERLTLLEEDAGKLPYFKDTYTQSSSVREDSITEIRGIELANIKNRTEAMEEAFVNIPEKYRQGLWDKLVNGFDYPDEYHLNTWKKWQQILIYHVATNLNLY